MTTFKDGPAKGTTLMLKRAPVFLRVVEEGGKIDALDQLIDEPRPGEKLYAYKLTGRPAMCHVHMARGRGGFYPLAEYAICDPQPTDEEMRTVTIWRAWCESQPRVSRHSNQFMKTGIELIAEERARQVSEEGWTAEHDDAHTGHQLATAAAFYAAPGNLPGIPTGVAPRSRLWMWWPFSREWRKETPKDRVRELVKAGALVAAEIDRLQRAVAKNG